jgi:hypothetical protein
MATLKDTKTGALIFLGGEQELGRAARCAIQLDATSVSALHASLRWAASEQWQVKDLGSRNGTQINGKHLSDKEWHSFSRDDTLVFGDSTWVMIDDGPPRPLVVPLGGGEPREMTDGVFVLPSDDAPLVTIFRNAHGDWQLELPDLVAVLGDQEIFSCASVRYRFIAGAGRATTPTANIEAPQGLEDCELGLRVSRDEENIEVSAKVRGKTSALGSHEQDFLLLALARHRLADRAQGLPETSCGWVYQDEVADALGVTRELVNVYVFRIRQQFAKMQLQGAAQIIERRPRSGQLRIGLARIDIERL